MVYTEHEVQKSECLLDAGYDSFEIHARIWRIFSIHPLIQFRADTIIHDEGTEERINYCVKLGEQKMARRWRYS